MIIFPDNQTRRQKGRGLFHADAVEVETRLEDQTVYIAPRVAPTGNTHHAGVAVPLDRRVILALAEQLGLALDLCPPTGPRPYRSTIQLHPIDKDGDHADSPADVVRWNVWVRRDFENGEFDANPDFDLTFETVTGAGLWLNHLHESTGWDWEIY